MNIIPLFPTIVLNDVINKKFTKKELDIIKYYSNKVMINKGNKSSCDKYILEKIEMFDLKKICLNYLNFYLKEIYKAKDDVEIYITQSWLNYSDENDYHHRHSHSNSFLSGVFYFDTNDNDKIFFMDGKYNAIEIESKSWDINNSKSWWIPVKNNEILIFPSHLTHEVPKIIGKKQRISLAFNLFIKGNLGNIHSSTELKL